MKKEFNHVKLRATLMKSKLRNTDEQTPAKKSGREKQKRLPFDARGIISVRLHPGGGPHNGL